MSPQKRRPEAAERAVDADATATPDATELPAATPDATGGFAEAEAEDDSSPAGFRSSLLQVVWLVTIAVVMAAIWIPGYIPTHDGPNHILAGYAGNHLDDATKGYGAYLKPGHPYNGEGFYLLFCPLERLLPWRVALNVTYSLAALLWMAGAGALVATVRRERAWLAIPLSGAALGWAFEMGFFSFWIGTGLTFLLLAWALSRKRWTPTLQMAAIAALAALEYVHLFAAIIAWAGLAAIAVTREDRPKLWRVVAHQIPGGLVVSLPALLTGRELASGSPSASGKWQHGTFADHAGMLANTFVSGPLWRAWPFALLAVAGIVTGVVRWARGSSSPGERALVLLSGSFAILSTVAPTHFDWLQFFSPRFVPVAIVGGVVLFPVERLDRRLVVVAAMALGIATPAWAAWWHVTISERHRELFIDGPMLPYRTTGRRLPLVLVDDPGPIRYQMPLVNAALIYPIEQGGMVPYLFATAPETHHILFKAPREQLFPEFPDRFYVFDMQYAELFPDKLDVRVPLTHAARVASRFDDVILYGKPDDVRYFESRGFVADWKSEQLFLGHFEGCPMKLAIHADSPLRAQLNVDYGWSPMADKHASYAFPAGTEVAPDRLLPLDGTPCGAIWLELSFDDDGVPGPSAGDSTCAESQGRLRVETEIRAKNAVVVCTDPKTSPHR